MYRKNKIRVYSGNIINIDKYLMDFGPGGQTEYELITFDVETGVSALPLIDRDNLLLIKHYQLGINDIGWSLPTGGLPHGEDPKARMQQELQEELGYKAGKLTLMARAHTMPGYIGTQAGYLFLAEDLIPSTLPGDEPYPIQVIKLSLDTALKKIRSGDINDSRTILAILYYVQFIRHARPT